MYVRKSTLIDATPARLWDILATPERIVEWMIVPPQVERPLREGEMLRWKDESGRPYLTGTVTRFEPAECLELELDDVSWKRKAAPGEVTYAMKLVAEAGATRLEFAMGDLSIDDEAEQWRDVYADGRELDAIKEMAEGRA